MKNFLISTIGLIGIGGVQATDTIVQNYAQANSIPPSSWIEIIQIAIQAVIAILSILGVRKVVAAKKLK